MMLPKKDTSAVALTLLLALVAAPKPLAASVRLQSLLFDSLLASAPTFSAPASVPNGTNVRVIGVPGMGTISQTLKQQFEKQFSGTTVNLQEANATDSLQSVLEGKADLAAIRRPLTAEEKAQGLVEVPVSREKIALVVGADNPFKGELTNEDFASIFRGELTDWQALGGAGTIRMVDRPETSDLRQAFRAYPVFQDFSSGANVARLPQDTTDAMIQSLGADGIGYAPVSQVANNPSIRVLPMYGTLPSDPAYPFSQPFSYVYKGANPSPAVQAFLGYATAPNIQPSVQEAKAAALAAGEDPVPGNQPAPASPITAAPITPDSPAAAPTAAAPDASPNSSPTATATATPTATGGGATGGVTGNTALVPGTDSATAEAQQGPFSLLWWLLPLGLIGLLFAWLLKGGREEEEYTDEEIELSTGGPEVDPNELGTTVPPYDRTNVELPDFRADAPATAGTGFATGAATALGSAAAVNAALSGTTPASTSNFSGAAPFSSPQAETEPVIGDALVRLTPRNARNAYASWEVSSGQKETLKAQGGKLYALRLYDVTGIDPLDPDKPLHLSYEQFECDEVAQDWHVSIPQGDRDYLVELGYVSEDGRWLTLGRSASVHIPPDIAGDAPAPISTFEEPTVTVPSASDSVPLSTPPTAPPILPASPAPALLTTPAAPDRTASVSPSSSGAAGVPSAQSGNTNKSRIVLEARNPQQAHVAWDVPEEYRIAIQQKGGKNMAIRLYDVTGIDVKTQPPHSVRQFTCNESMQEQNLPVPTSDRDYIAEIGYIMNNGRWLRLARSTPVHIPAAT